jgi:hypothetical protein
MVLHTVLGAISMHEVIQVSIRLSNASTAKLVPSVVGIQKKKLEAENSKRKKIQSIILKDMTDRNVCKSPA